MIRKSLTAFVVVFATAHACGPEEDLREACARVPLDQPLVCARAGLEARGAHYDGYRDDEHRWQRDRQACAVGTGDDGLVRHVRFLDQPAAFVAPR